MNINNKMSLFGEFALISMSYAPTKSEITLYTEDGVDKLPELKTSEKMTIFMDNYSFSWSETHSDSQPQQKFKQKFQFGSFGLNIGLKYYF